MSLACKSRDSEQIDNARPNYFQGSNSASLPGILDKNNDTLSVSKNYERKQHTELLNRLLEYN